MKIICDFSVFYLDETLPKGTVIEEVGRALVRGGYKIKVLNTIDFSCSMHYNPFVYLHCETDILTLVTVIMTNTQGEAKGGDDFWQKAEALLYQALIAYIYYEAPAEERNMNTLLDMLNACECREDDENFKSAVDLLFEQLEQRNPDHFAARQYKKFKMAAGKTLKSILISCGARLAPFDIAAVREIMSYDELELEKLGDEKTALFAVVSDTDPTFNFISAMMYSQMFNVLCDRALKVYHGRLPIHVTCLFDEFANQKIPNWEHLVSVIRSRNISAHIVLQTFSQLKGMYKDNAETVAGATHKCFNIFQKWFNDLFEKEYVGYRFVAGKIVPITDKIEMQEIEEACQTPFEGARIQLQKALGFLSNREHPDYKNCVKESISAVESVCETIVGSDNGATLGKAVKHLEEHGLKIHSSLREGISKLYGYACDQGGVRHGEGEVESTVTFEEAKLMMVTCSAIVNYLVAEYGKYGAENA